MTPADTNVLVRAAGMVVETDTICGEPSGNNAESDEIGGFN